MSPLTTGREITRREPDREPDRPVALIAHRGDGARSRENTLPAVVDAVRGRADAVEIDVKVTADGEVVLLHDHDLVRLWGEDRMVSECTASDLADLAARAGGRHQIPTLTTVLAMVGGTGTDLLIDLDDPRWAEPAWRVVAEAHGELVRADEVLWCGRPDALAVVRRLDPKARLVLSWDAGELPDPELLATLRPEFFNPHWPLITAATVAWSREQGLAVCCWTVDTEAQARTVLGLGVDAMITNDLPTVRRAVTALGRGAPMSNDDVDLDSIDLNSVDLERALRVALACAERATEITRDSPLGAVRTKKHAADVVTDVDTAVERAVRELITEAFPDHRVVGEEYGGTAGRGPAWYCDPVDGTTNLAAGLPWTSFSLSLAVGSRPLVGVVADPWRGEVLQAVTGRGALVDGAAPVLDPSRDSLSGGVVLTEWASYQPWPGMLDLLAALADRHCTTRVMGSSTLTLAHVAAGRASGAVIGEFHPEDHLAATLIAREAGLVVRDSDGRDDPFPSSGGILVARAAVADELFDLWQQAVSTSAG